MVDIQQRSKEWFEQRLELIGSSSNKMADGRYLYKFKCLSCGQIVEKRKSSGLQMRDCGKTCPSKYKIQSEPTYSLWKSIKQRCYNPNNQDYNSYGGRGIFISSEWIDNPLAFVNWAKSNGYKKGLQIDRVDNDGDYEPSNCRFVTNLVNSRNKRNSVLNPPLVRYIKRMLRIGMRQIDLANELNVSRNLIYTVASRQTWSDIK